MLLSGVLKRSYGPHVCGVLVYMEKFGIGLFFSMVLNCGCGYEKLRENVLKTVAIAAAKRL